VALRLTAVPSRLRTAGADLRPAAGIMAGHSLQHAYGNSFYVILPSIYTALGLSPVAAGLIGTVRQMSGGVATMGGGILVDRVQHWRVPILYLALTAMGFGYLLVGLAPSYLFIMLAIGLAGAAGSIWHPAALSLLSQRYPERRGLMVSLHRSVGNLGDTIGPLVVGTLLLVLAWQVILFAAFPAAMLLLLALWRGMHRASGWGDRDGNGADARRLREQLHSLGELFQGRALVMLLAVAGLSGLAQGGMLIWLGLYLQETQGMGSVGIGVHIALLTGAGTIATPLIGALSDRRGRRRIIAQLLVAKTVIAVLMALAGGGIALTILVAAMGAVVFAVNPLIQSAALDLADGRRLEGTMIGLLWGNNAVFIGAAPLLVGVLVSSVGFGILFWYVAVVSAIGLLAALALPARALR
jgi:MFS family permease